MDKTLDDIISSKPKARRGGARRGARTQILGSAPVISPAARARARTRTRAGAVPPVTAAQASPTDKIIVSNLPQDVNEVQIKELFHSTVGPLRQVTLHYDSVGRSTGVAAVQFQRAGDGTKAYTQYNNRLIDGRRPMKIEIVVDPSRPAPLAQRVAPAPAPAAVAANSTKTPRTGGGSRRRGRGGKARRAPRPGVSAADLDAEMEDYTASNAPTAVA